MYWSGLLMGFFGSFHCVGMCGPIVLALPKRGVRYQLLYNSGRTITYMLLGFGVGLVGQGAAFAGLQQYLSVGVGLAMLLVVLFTKYKHFDLPVTGFLGRLYQWVKGKLGVLFKSNSLGAPLFIGMLNGLLPCGLVYAALFAALAMGSMVAGLSYMFFFGIGTLPMLLGLGVFTGWVTPAVRAKLNKLVPYFLILVALLLILRGLNLGIPYVSPKLDGGDHMPMHH